MNERLKYWQANDARVQRYYWRSLGNELDLIEANGSAYAAYDFSYQDRKLTTPKYFADTYPNTQAQLIHPANLFEWLHSS
jgi:hypothetical protein